MIHGGRTLGLCLELRFPTVGDGLQNQLSRCDGSLSRRFREHLGSDGPVPTAFWWRIVPVRRPTGPSCRAKSGVLDRAFEQLQQAQVVQIEIEAVSLDSTGIKVHPDGTAARIKIQRLPASPVAAGTPRTISSPQTHVRT